MRIIFDTFELKGEKFRLDLLDGNIFKAYWLKDEFEILAFCSSNWNCIKHVDSSRLKIDPVNVVSEYLEKQEIVFWLERTQLQQLRQSAKNVNKE
jgi:hypothetical protein